MKHDPIIEAWIRDCDHHSHKWHGDLRCCRCGAVNVIGIGWTPGRYFGPLGGLKCREDGRCS